MRQTSTSLLIAFLVAVIAAQAVFVNVADGAANGSDDVGPLAGLLGIEAEWIDGEDRQESAEDSDEQIQRHSNSDQLTAQIALLSDVVVTRKTRRRNFGQLRTRAP